MQKNKIGFTGYQVVSEITGFSIRYISKLMNSEKETKTAALVKNEADQYLRFQQGYINRRKTEISFK